MNVPPSVADVFFAALEQRDPEQRKAILDRICGDDLELRRQAERLLAAHDDAGDFLAEPLRGLPPTLARFTGIGTSPGAPIGSADLSGTGIGRYRLLEQIGEGGMGVVYMAEQRDPIRRRVALKIIKPGLDTKQVIARFEAERQALALMDHPNIARVLDAGATDLGRPYFVMELVRGVPITEYCDQERLSIPQRLELFVLVCQAVHHAHQKGIIHRDIKPSNVLVTVNDGRAVPKIIDFGVAKATNQQLTDRTLFTNFSQVVGTPLYMSPEQAEMTSVDVDTRSDVYSLGMLLYELLTGTTPFARQLLRDKAFDEVLRIIREETPPRPSTRISTLGQTRTLVAAQRQADPDRLHRLVRGDLDWIVMKSLEKNRMRRYDSAAGLAADVRRYLASEPIEAGPPSAIYRLRKFARRNRAAVATLTTVFAALILGTTVSTWQAVRATRAERRADQQSAEAHASALAAQQERERADSQAQDAQSKAREAIAERERAEEAFRQARQAVDDSFTLISENEIVNSAGLQPLRKALLEHALQYYEGFLRDRVDDRDLRIELAKTYIRVGHIRQMLGEMPASEEAYQQAANKFTVLVQENSADASLQHYLGISLRDLGIVQRLTGHTLDAERLLLQAVAIQNPVLEQAPANVDYRRSLANSYNNLGNVYTDANRKAEAEGAYEQAIAILVALPTGDPQNVDVLADLAGVYNNLGGIQRVRGSSHAEESYRKAVSILEGLSRSQQHEGRFLDSLARAYNNLAGFLEATGRTEDADKLFSQVLEIKERRARENPAIPDHRSALADGYYNLARSQHISGRIETSETLGRQALEIQQRLVSEYPTVFEYQRKLANSYALLSMIAVCADRNTTALDFCHRAAAIYDSLAQVDPQNHDSALGAEVCRGCLLRLWAFEGVGDSDEIIRVAAMVRKQKRLDAKATIALAAALFRLGQYQDASVVIDQGITLANISRRFQLNFRQAGGEYHAAIAQLVRAMIEYRIGNLDQAREALRLGEQEISELKSRASDGRFLRIRSDGIDVAALLDEAASIVNP